MVLQSFYFSPRYSITKFEIRVVNNYADTHALGKGALLYFHNTATVFGKWRHPSTFWPDSFLTSVRGSQICVFNVVNLLLRSQRLFGRPESHGLRGHTIFKQDETTVCVTFTFSFKSSIINWMSAWSTTIWTHATLANISAKTKHFVKPFRPITCNMGHR